MINANELRMGSLIEKDNVMYKFLSLEQNHTSTSEYRWYWVETLDGKLGHYYYSHFKPIPLTPEILEKCGAEKFPTGKKDYSLQGVLLSYADCRGIYTHKGKELPSLHVLQNYIFALTNSELNYTP